MNMQRPIVSANTDMVAKRSSWVPYGIEIGLSVHRNSPARPSAITVQTAAVCRGVERSEAKLKMMNSVHRNSMLTCGAM